MTRGSVALAAIAVMSLVSGMCLWPPERASTVRAEDPTAPRPDPAVAGSTVAALLDANNGRPPATGAELWQVLGKVGKFGQLPVVFSGVRLDAGISNPRVVIAPLVDGQGEADAASPSFSGRLFLAANMERDPFGGDPKVTSVEFISWNGLRRQFDFGVIEGMGTGDPKLRVLDGGRCFAGHKNKGPILGATPWTNTTHRTDLRTLVANRHKLVDVVPPGAAGVRDRIDGMALAAPQADAVDAALRQGAALRLKREMLRLMNRSESGRKAFVALLVAVTQPGPLAADDKVTRFAVDAWGNDSSYLRFTKDAVALARSTNTGMLIDFDPIPKPLGGWGAPLGRSRPSHPARGSGSPRRRPQKSMR